MSDVELSKINIKCKVDEASEAAVGKGSKPEGVPELTPEKKQVFKDPKKGSILAPDGGLAAHEGVLGAHAIKMHVGWRTKQLIDRASEMRSAASSFLDRATAERACAGAIETNQAKIAQFLSSAKKKELIIKHDCDFTTGVFVSKKTLAPESVNGVRLILRKSSELPGGYKIHTAFPTRELEL